MAKELCRSALPCNSGRKRELALVLRTTDFIERWLPEIQSHLELSKGKCTAMQPNDRNDLLRATANVVWADDVS